MADVFISYAREDRARAEQVARGLQAMGLEAFWDTEIPPGQTWADYIEGKLAQCKSVVVLWSQHSTKSQWVREEARMGRDKAKLIPAMLDGSPMPFGFGEVQAADLSTWRGEGNHRGWMSFAQAVHRAVRGDEAPAPAPQTVPPVQPQRVYATPPPPTSFGQPGDATANLSPIGYIQKCLRLFIDGKGRARRAEYAWYTLFAYATIFVGLVLDVAMSGLNPMTQIPNDNYIITFLILVVLLFPGVAAASRRLHDIGQTGWLAVLCVIPYVAYVATLALIFVPGQPGENKYGPDPKGV